MPHPRKAYCYGPESKTLVDMKFNFTEWWKIAESENLNKLFDVGEELVEGLLYVLEMVSTLFYT